MARFKVTWKIDIEAGTPSQAARQALAIQRDPESTATVFDVRYVGPCSTCKQHVVHRPDCRIATRDMVTRVDTPRTINVGQAKP